MNKITTFLRYPGSKRRMLDFLAKHLPQQKELTGRFVEPFVGGGAIYFYLQPSAAVLGDINPELIDLYRGIRKHPDQVWRIYRQHPSGKKGYSRVRALDASDLTLAQKAARSLYLNRTCFKGMWRHNLAGQFNIGYGGQSRRWAIRRSDLLKVSRLLRRASLRCADFEVILDLADPKDFAFLDPPYRPGQKDQRHQHYAGQSFTFGDHQRLARCLRKADKRGLRWALTVSSHRDILNLYRGFRRVPIPRGTGRRIGAIVQKSGEALISNN